MAGPQSSVYVISGVVRSARGQPIAEARVYVTHSPTPLPDIAALTDEQGTFAFAVPAPGEYVLECTAEEWGSVSATVTVPEARARRVTVEIRFKD